MPAPWHRGFQVRVVGSIHGQETNNVMNFATNTIINDDPNELRNRLIELATHVLDCIVETFLPAVTQEWRILRVEARQIFPTPSDPIEVPGTDPVMGTLSAASHSFAATLVQLRTGTGGRKGRGRMFLPPVGEGQTSTSDIDGPTLVLITAFLACLAGKFIGANPSTVFRWGVLSRVDAGANNANFNVGFREIITATATPTVALLSSRKKGRGN